MKNSKKGMAVFGMLLVSLLCCSFSVLPMVTLASEHNDFVKISYLGAIKTNDTLSVYVNYANAGADYEVLRDIVVSTTSDYSNILPIARCAVDKGNYVYDFNMVESSQKIYVKPPVLLMETKVDPFTRALVEREAITSPKTAGFENDKWFSISDVKISQNDDGVFRVCVMIVPHADIIPSLPMLVIGEKQYGGTSAMKFNQNDEFCSGELIFAVPAEEINTAALNVGGVDAVAQTMSLSVSHALKKVECNESLFSSGIKVLPVMNES